MRGCLGGILRPRRACASHPSPPSTSLIRGEADADRAAPAHDGTANRWFIDPVSAAATHAMWCGVLADLGARRRRARAGTLMTSRGLLTRHVVPAPRDGESSTGPNARRRRGRGAATEMSGSSTRRLRSFSIACIGYAPPAMPATENAPLSGSVAADGVDDADRVAYMRDHLVATPGDRAAYVEAYFAWSLMDTTSGASATEGFGSARGTSILTQTRTPKAIGRGTGLLPAALSGGHAPSRLNPGARLSSSTRPRRCDPIPPEKRHFASGSSEPSVCCPLDVMNSNHDKPRPRHRSRPGGN